MTTTQTEFTSASGIAYEDAQDLVETIVSIKKVKYKYPGVDQDDLAQDIRIMCWDALENKYDPSKVGKSVFHFVARVVDNGLYNKFRGVYLDNNPPCIRCSDYDKATKTCMIDEVGCDRIVSYRDRMKRKRAIAAPLSYNAQLDSDGENDFTHHASLSVGSLTGVSDLSDSFREALDEMLVPYYDRMISGEGEVPVHYRRLIQRQIKAVREEQE